MEAIDREVKDFWTDNPDYSPAEQMLKTRVQAIHYDFNTCTGTVDLVEPCCVDMSGVLAFFESIDPRVTTIVAGDRIYEHGEYCWLARINPNPTHVKENQHG